MNHLAQSDFLLHCPSLPNPTLSHVVSFPFLSYPLMSSPLMSYPLLSPHVLSYTLMSSPTRSCPLLSCPLLHSHVLSSPLMSSPLMSSHTLACLLLSCPLPSSHVLSSPLMSSPLMSFPLAVSFTQLSSGVSGLQLLSTHPWREGGEKERKRKTQLGFGLDSSWLELLPKHVQHTKTKRSWEKVLSSWFRSSQLSSPLLPFPPHPCSPPPHPCSPPPSQHPRCSRSFEVRECHESLGDRDCSLL